MKHIGIIFIMLLTICLAVPVFAGDGMTLTLPNGSIIPLDGLSADEVRRMSELVNKTMKSNTSDTMVKVTQVATDTMSDPAKLDAWRKMVTGTIKDVCGDLNVAVNEFVKTPVGLGVSALILYNVAGKDALGVGVHVVRTIFRVIVLVPLWLIIMGILLFLRKKYFSTIVVYNKKKKELDENGKPRTLYVGPELQTAYPWKSSDSRSGFAFVLVIVGILSTIVAVALIV